MNDIITKAKKISNAVRKEKEADRQKAKRKEKAEETKLVNKTIKSSLENLDDKILEAAKRGKRSAEIYF